MPGTLSPAFLAPACLPTEMILLSLLDHRLLDALHRAAPDFQLARSLQDAFAGGQ